MRPVIVTIVIGLFGLGMFQNVRSDWTMVWGLPTQMMRLDFHTQAVCEKARGGLSEAVDVAWGGGAVSHVFAACIARR